MAGVLGGNRFPADELSEELGTTLWRLPWEDRVTVVRADGTPAWWTGDEDASSSFLSAMGVRLD